MPDADWGAAAVARLERMGGLGLKVGALLYNVLLPANAPLWALVLPAHSLAEASLSLELAHQDYLAFVAGEATVYSDKPFPPAVVALALPPGACQLAAGPAVAGATRLLGRDAEVRLSEGWSRAAERAFGLHYPTFAER